MSSDDEDYEVGYGKPPKDSRFKLGQSGNPNGRPKGSRNRVPSEFERIAYMPSFMMKQIE